MRLYQLALVSVWLLTVIGLPKLTDFEILCAVPSRVRNRLQANRVQSSGSKSRSPQHGSDSGTATRSDPSSGGYASSTQRPQYGYPPSGGSGYVGNGLYGSQQQYGQQQYDQQQFSQQSRGRQVVPVGKSTYPYAVSGIYSGQSQNPYSSQPVPLPSAYRGGQAGYPMQQSSWYRPPVQQSYYPQQQFSQGGYAGGHPTQGNLYGNSYGGMGYGNARTPVMQYPQSYGQPSLPYGRGGE